MKVKIHNEKYNITVDNINKAIPSLVNNGRRFSSGSDFKDARLNDLIKIVLHGLKENRSAEAIQEAKLLLRAFHIVKDRGYESTGKMSNLNFPVSWVVRVKHFFGRIQRIYLLSKLKKTLSNVHPSKTSNTPLNNVKKVEQPLPIYNESSKKFPLPMDVIGEFFDRSDLKGQIKLGLANKNCQAMLKKILSKKFHSNCIPSN